MPRIALILGGAGSLGAYVAGAVTEILTALDRNRGEPCTVDIVTGTSSGAFTAALTARALVRNPSLLPWLEKVWVHALDAEVLLDPGRPDRTGLLDGSVLDELSRALVTAEPAADDRPAPLAGDPLRVGIVLTALHGRPRAVHSGLLDAPDRLFGARRHGDHVTFELPPGMDAGSPVWEGLRRAAVASASPPLAFPVRPLETGPGGAAGFLLPGAGTEGVTRWYADGELGGGGPLALAARLAARCRGEGPADRRYIVVDPSMVSGPPGAEAEHLPPGTVGEIGELLARAVRRGMAPEWEEAADINARLQILGSLAGRLPEVGDRVTDPGAVEVGQEIGQLAERVAELEMARGSPVPEGAGGDPVVTFLDRRLSRILEDDRYAGALARVETRAGRTRLAKLIFILEVAGGLGGREFLPLYLVAPGEPGKLSGSFLAGFGGFLHRAWRENDFRAGRRDARDLLEKRLGEVVSYGPDPDEAYEVRPLEASFGALPADARRRVEDFVQDEADRVLDGVRAGFPASLFGWAWKPALRRWARRRAMEGLASM